MYQHILVPIDDTPISAANVAVAIDLAKRLSARVTFFHATRDWSATEDGALMRTLKPESFAEDALGSTHALLSKAMASANAEGVACASASRICDRPAEAIVEEAGRLACDLIVMASRGNPRGPIAGWLHSSQTERVLRAASVALLVTRVAANQPLSAAERALGIIEDEHRSIAVVTSAMRDIVRQGNVEQWVEELPALEAMLAYLKAFPELVHHPKEEKHLHSWLRLRSADAALTLDEIERQHARELELIERVAASLADAKADGAAAAQPLREAVERFSDHVFRHLAFEEATVFPRAREVLVEADWKDIAGAFESNDDPRYGELPADEFRRLFTRVANSIAGIKSRIVAK